MFYALFLMFASHFFAGESFLVVVLDKFFSFGRQKKWSLVALYSNDCTGIRLGGLRIGRLRRVVVLQRWSSEQV